MHETHKIDRQIPRAISNVDDSYREGPITKPCVFLSYYGNILKAVQ